jgi:hypothetical protein
VFIASRESLLRADNISFRAYGGTNPKIEDICKQINKQGWARLRTNHCTPELQSYVENEIKRV